MRKGTPMSWKMRPTLRMRLQQLHRHADCRFLDDAGVVGGQTWARLPIRLMPRGLQRRWNGMQRELKRQQRKQIASLRSQERKSSARLRRLRTKLKRQERRNSSSKRSSSRKSGSKLLKKWKRRPKELQKRRKSSRRRPKELQKRLRSVRRRASKQRKKLQRQRRKLGQGSSRQVMRWMSKTWATHNSGHLALPKHILMIASTRLLR
mmetsp:Transcript_13926/g.32873  ORF Transcript_13926/g.32873 Transcript_13926/m.32873 type:complete len:207 (-) Transcript_13926:1611-2231(-)